MRGLRRFITLRRTCSWRFSGTNCREIGIIIALSFACWPAEMFLRSVSPASVGQNSWLRLEAADSFCHRNNCVFRNMWFVSQRILTSQSADPIVGACKWLPMAPAGIRRGPDRSGRASNSRREVSSVETRFELRFVSNVRRARLQLCCRTGGTGVLEEW